MMLDVISIGSAVIDIFVFSGQFSLESSQQGILLCQEFGDKVQIDDLQLHTGGGGGNTAVGFARMGFNAGVLTETGKDNWSRIVIDEFHKEYVSTNSVVSERRERTGGSVILVNEAGERMILVHRGASSMIDPHDIPTDKLAHARWIHLSSIAGQLETIKTIFQTIEESGTKLSWNPGKAELKLLKTGEIPINTVPAEILFVNKREWDSLEDRQQALKDHLGKIVITNGAKGGVLLAEEEELRFEALSADVVDTTGAGDAFAVGYVSAVLYEKEPQVAVRWGARNAHSVIQQVGAKPGLLAKTHMEIT